MTYIFSNFVETDRKVKAYNWSQLQRNNYCSLRHIMCTLYMYSGKIWEIFFSLVIFKFGSAAVAVCMSHKYT